MSVASAAHRLPSGGPFSPAESPPFMTSRLLVIVAVIGCHVLALWALQNGLLRRVVETIVPVQVLADFMELPQPRVEPAPPPQPRPEPARPRPVTPRAPVPAPQPEPLPVADAAPQAPIEVAAPVQPEPQPVTAPLASSTPPTDTPPAPPVIVLPSSNAAYLNNPPPAYPPLSVRLNEQGTVRLRAYVGTDGRASSITVMRSSGFPRLDQAAVESVYRWRFAPGTRDGQPIPMWTEVPVRFQLSLNP